MKNLRGSETFPLFTYSVTDAIIPLSVLGCCINTFLDTELELHHSRFAFAMLQASPQYFFFKNARWACFKID